MAAVRVLGGHSTSTEALVEAAEPVGLVGPLRYVVVRLLALLLEPEVRRPWLVETARFKGLVVPLR